MIILFLAGIASIIWKRKNGDFKGESRSMGIMHWVFFVYCAVLTLFCCLNMNEALTATFEGVVKHGMIFLNIAIFIPLAVIGRLGNCHPFDKRKYIIILTVGIIVVTEAVRSFLLFSHAHSLSEFGLNSCLLNFIGVILGCMLADLHLYRKGELQV